MANKKITELTALTAPAPADVVAVVDDVAGTPETKKVTLADLAKALPVEFLVACTDEDTAIDATGTKVSWRMPHAMVLTSVRASLVSPCTTGTFTIDINEAGTTVLSTKLTLDAGEKTSTTATTAAVISDAALADDAEITVDVDDIGDGTAAGLKIALIGHRA